MSNFWLKSSYWEKVDLKNFDFLSLKNLSPGQFFTQISLNFKTSCCNLKIKGLGAKLCVIFLLF